MASLWDCCKPNLLSQKQNLVQIPRHTLCQEASFHTRMKNCPADAAIVPSTRKLVRLYHSKQTECSVQECLQPLQQDN